MAETMMPAETWPVVDDSEDAWARTLSNERAWITTETVSLLRDVRHGLNDCYALLAPIDPGSTLVVSTPRNEKVKGTITRVGTRIVRGTLHVQLRTQPALAVTIDPANPIPVAPLAAIHAHLTRCTDLVGLILASAAGPAALTPEALAAQLRIMAHALADSTALLAGPKPLLQLQPANALSRPATAHSHHSHVSHYHAAAAAAATTLPPPQPGSPLPDWTTASAAPGHFTPPLPPTLSLHLSVADSYMVIALRGLEPADAPVNLGTKLGLAIGTVRRLEHDEMDRVFRYAPGTSLPQSNTFNGSGSVGGSSLSKIPSASTGRRREGGREPAGTEVYVREKVLVESADPCLMSLAAKLTSLNHTLAQARRNLADVLDADYDE